MADVAGDEVASFGPRWRIAGLAATTIAAALAVGACTSSAGPNQADPGGPGHAPFPDDPGVGGWAGDGGAPPNAGAGTGTGAGAGAGAGTGADGDGDSASAGIEAGEWDDNAKYREFLKFLAKSEALPFTKIDVSDRQFVVVVDAFGSPVANCPVQVWGQEGGSATVTTRPSGRTPLFPRAAGVKGKAVAAIASCAEGSATVVHSIDGVDNAIVLKLAQPRAKTAPKKVDVAFVVDATGSMGEEIAAVKATIAEIAKQLGPTKGLAVRVGMVAYRDYGDAFVTQTYPLSADLAAFAWSVVAVVADGGGDYPEAVNEAMHAAAALAWDETAFARFVFLVGDAPPRPGEPYSYAKEALGLHARGIEAHTVAASGMDALGQVVWRQIAQVTYGKAFFVAEGGAGPESKGGGAPKASCGGVHKTFTTGKLHELVVGAVLDEIAAYDADPFPIPGLGGDVQPTSCADGGS